MSGPSYHGQTHKRGGTDEAGIVATDGVTTIDPAGELSIGTGLVLTDLGAGIAQVETAARAFAVGHTATTAVPGNNGQMPFTTDASNGITVGTNQWTIDTSDWYLLSGDAGLKRWGPSVAYEVVFWSIATGGGGTNGFAVFTIENALAGITDYVEYGLSISVPTYLPAGTVLTIDAGVDIGGVVSGTGSLDFTGWFAVHPLT